MSSSRGSTCLHRDINLCSIEPLSTCKIVDATAWTKPTACRKRRARFTETVTNETDVCVTIRASKRAVNREEKSILKKTRIQSNEKLGLITKNEPPQRWNKERNIKCPNVVAGKDGIIRTSERAGKVRYNKLLKSEGGAPDKETTEIGLSRDDNQTRDNPSHPIPSEERKSPLSKCELIRPVLYEDFLLEGSSSSLVLNESVVIEVEEVPSAMVIVCPVAGTSLAYSNADFPVSANCHLTKDKEPENFTKWKKQLMANGPQDEKSALDLQHALMADRDGDRALHIAVVHQDVLLVRQLSSLIRSIGVSVDMYNHMRQTPLHLAVILQNPHLCEALLEEGALTQSRDRHGNTALHLAIEYNTNECLLVLLRSKCAQEIVNIRNYEGLSSLHLTIQKKNMLAAYYLVKAGCDINVQEGKSGRTPLMNAVYSRHIDMVKILLKLGANVLASDYSGNNALNAANELDLKDLLTLLETKINSQNKF